MWHYTTVMIDPSLLLPYMMRECKDRGVTLNQRSIDSLAPLVEEYDVVFNCCGLGAVQLAGDRNVKPARGVTVRLAAPWIKTFLITNGLPSHGKGKFTHIFPRVDMAIVGGVKGDDDLRDTTSTEEVNEYVVGLLRTKNWEWNAPFYSFVYLIPSASVGRERRPGTRFLFSFLYMMAAFTCTCH